MLFRSPAWCFWEDIYGVQTRPRGLCDSGYWPDVEAQTRNCDYYLDHPQFRKRLATSTEHNGMVKGYQLRAFLLD